MSPSAPAGVPAQLRHLIYYHLDNGYLENALFFAGRLHALEPRSHDAAHLLALCNLKLGRNKAAFDYAKPKGTSHQHLGCAYVFAQACLALERFDAGTTALEKSRGLWTTKNHWNKHSDSARIHLPDAAACYCLLGKLWQAHGDTKKAVDNYIESLKLNPCMWDAFTALCDMGTAVRPVNIFKVTPEILASLATSLPAGQSSHNSMPQEAPDTRNPFVSTPDNDPFNPRTGGDIGLNLGGANLLSRLNGMTNGHGHGSAYPDVDTPTSNAQNVPDNDIMMGDAVGPVMNEGGEMPHAPVRKTRTQAYNATEDPPRMRPITTRTRLKMGSESSESTDIPRPIGQNGHKRTVSGHSTHHSQQSQQSQQSSMAPSDPTAAPPRRSVRLLNHIRPSASRFAGATARDAESKEKRDLKKKATGTKGKTASTSTAGRVVSGNRRPAVDTSEPTSKPDLRPSSSGLMRAPPPRMAAPKELAQGKDSIEWLLDLLRKIGTGYSQLSRYQCVQALEAFATVPTQQRETPWVLAQIGKAQYERCMYSEAEKVFQRVREKAPTSLDGMEVFSNVLWQLKKETDLAYLAHTLLEQDRLSPEAWCALGNSFSLQREHDQAIKCFSRATQLDPEFAYAFTLQGHEHLANEEFDKAMLAYRCAISADNRHYNGWYGLGQVFEKMGKYDVAEKHFRAAAQINPTNPFLAVRIGAVLDRMRKTQPALMQYMAAIALDPRSTVARFRKAEIHLKLGSPLEALKDLEYLKDCIPDDANVHFLLGRTYNMIGERGNAIRHYTIAMNLDPKAQSLIKEAMEKVGEDDGEGWSSDDDR